MVLRHISLVVLPVATGLAFAGDAPRVPPDTAAMSQSIAAPPAASAPGESRRAAPPARKADRVRHTIPAPKRM